MRTPEAEIHRLFPTWVFEFRLPDHETKNARWAQYVADIDARTRDMLLFQTSNNLHELPEFASLAEYIHAAARVALQTLDASYEDVVITGCWANLQRKGSTFAAHSHPNNFLSGVYYVQAPKNCGSVVFKKRVLNDIVPLFTAPNALNEVVHRWEPEPGMLLIFPSWLEHYVERNRSDETRISISFNLMFRGLLGSNATLTSTKFD